MNSYCIRFLKIVVFIIFSAPLLAQPNPKLNLPLGLSYQYQQKENQKIHILTIDPKYYKLSLVKAQHTVFGRETVYDMAAPTEAIAAINGGFFEIGKRTDGRPTGTLIINNDIFSIRKTEQSLLIIDDKSKQLHLKRGKVAVLVKSNGRIISVNKINQYMSDKDVGLFQYTFGPTTATSMNRHEVLIDNKGKVIDIIHHGNNKIPHLGWILSVPKSYPVNTLKIGDKINIVSVLNTQNKMEKMETISNALTGIPMLVQNGRVISGRLGNQNFAEKPHARTAIGLRSDGTIVIVVAEQHIPLFNKFADQLLQSSGGLTLKELAKLMVALKCENAMNLDGGGSSSLYLNGKIINTTIGDADESLGEKTLRRVSDAILVIKR